MQPYISKILIALIVAVVIVGGGLLWWLYSLTPQDVGSAGQAVQNGVYYSGADNQSTVTTPIIDDQTQTQTTDFPDIRAAYQTLFPQILGTEVAFTQAGAASTGDLKSLYAFYANNVEEEEKAYPTAGPLVIDIALIDLTEDGTPEAIVFESLPDYCGSGGCMLEIYKKTSGVWTKIFSSIGGGEVGLSNTITNGYFDLYLSVRDKNTVNRYVWDGSTYQFKEVMAVWNGTSFTLPQ